MDSLRQIEPKPPATTAPAPTVLRTYGIGAQILKDLGLKRHAGAQCADNNSQGLSAFDLQITEYVDGGE